MNVIIMGGGSAGPTCAFELRRINKDINITVLEASSNTEYSHCALPYVLSGEIKTFDNIFIFDEKEYTSNNLFISLNSEVLDIDRKKKVITYKKSKEKIQIIYDKLVLATGSTAFIPAIKGTEKADYFTLKTIDDAKKISICKEKDENAR